MKKNEEFVASKHPKGMAEEGFLVRKEEIKKGTKTTERKM